MGAQGDVLGAQVPVAEVEVGGHLDEGHVRRHLPPVVRRQQRRLQQRPAPPTHHHVVEPRLAGHALAHVHGHIAARGLLGHPPADAPHLPPVARALDAGRIAPAQVRAVLRPPLQADRRAGVIPLHVLGLHPHAALVRLPRLQRDGLAAQHVAVRVVVFPLQGPRAGAHRLGDGRVDVHVGAPLQRAAVVVQPLEARILHEVRELGMGGHGQGAQQDDKEGGVVHGGFSCVLESESVCVRRLSRRGAAPAPRRGPWAPEPPLSRGFRAKPSASRPKSARGARECAGEWGFG